MRRWLVPLYALLGFLLVVALLPQSRWVLLRQGDVLAGRWRTMGGYSQYEAGSFVRPVQRGLDAEDAAPDETARFLRLVTPSRNEPGPDAFYRRMVALHAICKEKARPEYWAQLVRMASYHGMIQPLPSGKRPQVPHLGEMREILLEACRAGARLDPDNAFFAIVASGTLQMLGEQEASRQTYLAASRLPKYEDYAEFEPALRYRYLVENYGYRGRLLQAWILADTPLPHLAVIRSVARHFADTGEPTLRAATARVAGLMMSQDQGIFGFMVGRALLIQALSPGMEVSLDARPKPEEVVRLAAALEAQAPGDQGILPVARSYNRLAPAIQTQWQPAEDDIRLVVNLNPAFSGWSLLSLLMLPAALAAAWLKARSPRFAAASPYLALLLMFPSEPAFGFLGRPEPMSQGTPVVFFPALGAASLLFFPALFPSLRRYVDFLGVVVIVIGAFLSVDALPLAIPTLLFAVSLGLERKAKRMPEVLTAAFLVLACALAAGYWVAITVQEGVGNGIVFGVVALTGALAAIPARAPVRWAVVAGASSLLIGLGFGVMIARDLAEDKQLAIVCDELLNEADRVRAKAGIYGAG